MSSCSSHKPSAAELAHQRRIVTDVQSPQAIRRGVYSDAGIFGSAVEPVQRPRLQRQAGALPGGGGGAGMDVRQTARWRRRWSTTSRSAGRNRCTRPTAAPSVWGREVVWTPAPHTQIVGRHTGFSYTQKQSPVGVFPEQSGYLW